MNSLIECVEHVFILNFINYDTDKIPKGSTKKRLFI